MYRVGLFLPLHEASLNFARKIAQYIVRGSVHEMGKFALNSSFLSVNVFST